jgi:hypothetical protein
MTIIKEIIELSLDIQRKEPPVPRNQHPKSHGCVRAEFIVERDIPENMRFGVFKEQKTYPAWIRFSNGKPLPDANPDQKFTSPLQQQLALKL